MFLNIKIPMIESIPSLIREAATTTTDNQLVPAISVIGLPYFICQEIRQGANAILKNPSFMVEGPAGSEKLYVHNTNNGSSPFTVSKPREKGKQKDIYTCDVKVCRRFKMHEFCEHVCAAAKREDRLESFLKKLSTRNIKSTISKAANASKDEGKSYFPAHH